jgi:hypothetical protein
MSMTIVNPATVQHHRSPWHPSHSIVVIKNVTYAHNAIMHAMATALSGSETTAVGFDLEWKAGSTSSRTVWPATIQLSFAHVTLVLLPFYMEGESTSTDRR